MRKVFLAVVLLALAAPAVRAEELHAALEGPDRSGYYTLRAVGLAAGDRVDPMAYAEGAVDGKPSSVLIHLDPTGEHGTYRFPRTWPAGDHWMIRLALGHPPAPATVVTLRADGTVGSSKLYRKTDGGKECRQVLKKYWTRWKEDDDC